jgi:hypothetical protein
VDPDGRVSGLTLESHRLRGSALETCLRAAARQSWSFPTNSVEYDVVLPIELATKERPAAPREPTAAGLRFGREEPGPTHR